jgi:hypothetical protein
MKVKKNGKKLVINKTTVAHLNPNEMKNLKAGKKPPSGSTCPGCMTKNTD